MTPISDIPHPISDIRYPKSTVLIVDDEKSIRLTLSAFLEEAGFEVLLARDGREALRMIEEQPPDVVVTDIVMPEEDGLGLIRQMHSRFPQIPFIVMTGAAFVGEIHLAAARAFGAASVLRKPFSRNRLVEELRRVLEEQMSRGNQGE